MQYVDLYSLSESASSCSRMRLPSLSEKLRTQPTREAGLPCSMRLASTTACHWSWRLKSRSTSHTRPIGASRTVERTTFCSIASAALAEVLLQRVEAALEHLPADVVRQLLLTPRLAFELGAPLGERAPAIGHGPVLEGGLVVVL